MSSIFVTGGSGFIGRHVLAALAKANHKLYVLVRSKERLVEAMREAGCSECSSIIPLQGDLTQPSLGLSTSDLQQLLNVDIIIHAGGPMDILLEAEEAQRVFLDAAQEISVLAKMIHDSNGLQHFIHVVGYKSPYSDQDNRSGLNSSHEHHEHNPKDPPYERVKFEADLFIRQTMHHWGIPLSVVNPSAVIGHSFTGITEQTGGLGILVNAVRSNLMALTPGGKDYWLPLVHVDHVASLISALVEQDNPADCTYFLLDKKSNSPNIVELVRMISKEVRVKGPFGSLPYRFIKAILHLGADKMLGLPKESVDFITTTEFPTASKEELGAAYHLDLSISESTLPFVIADLDYRLSHGSLRTPEPFHFHRRSNLATIESDGSGIPIVVLHGIFSTSFNMLPMAQHLSQLGNPIYLVDLPGFGRSPFHHSHTTLGGFEQSIAELIHSIDSKVILVGHSFGGFLAANMMETMQERIEKAILLQPVLHPISALCRSSLLTETVLRFVSASSLRRSMLLTRSFDTEVEVPEGYISFIHNELKSPRVRKTTAEALRALSKSNNVNLNPSSWDRNKVSILWGTKESMLRIPKPFRHVPITHLPYAHQFPISYPEATAHVISEMIHP